MVGRRSSPFFFFLEAEVVGPIPSFISGLAMVNWLALPKGLGEVATRGTSYVSKNWNLKSSFKVSGEAEYAR